LVTFLSETGDSGLMTLTYCLLPTTTARIPDIFDQEIMQLRYKLAFNNTVRPVNFIRGYNLEPDSVNALESACIDAFDQCSQDKINGVMSQPVVLLYQARGKRNRLGLWSEKKVLVKGYHQFDYMKYIGLLAKRQRGQEVEVPQPEYFSDFEAYLLNRQVSIPA